VSETDPFTRRWPHYHKRPLALGPIAMSTIEQASVATGIEPHLIFQAFLLGHYGALSADAGQRLLAWCNQVQLDAEARKVLEFIEAAPDLDASAEDKVIWLVRSGAVDLQEVLGKLQGDSSSPPPSAGGEDHRERR
jgi:hypothetical protein